MTDRPAYGLRSTQYPDWRRVGLWRPLVAIVAGMAVPAVLAVGLLMLAGSPGALESSGSRAVLLLWLYALASAPLVGWLLLPILWPLLLILIVRGWSGLGLLVLAAWALGLPVAHVLLNGDLTTETPAMVLVLAAALTVQAGICWLVLWAMRPKLR